MENKKKHNLKSAPNILRRIINPVDEFFKNLTPLDLISILLAVVLGFIGIQLFGGIRSDKAKIWLSIIAVILLIAAWIVARIPKIKWAKVVVTGLIAALTLTSVVVSTGNSFGKITHRSKGKTVISQDAGLVRSVQAWNMFHYVLASKYFDEVGYFDLYKAAILADNAPDGHNYFEKLPKIRDMKTYDFVPMNIALAEAKAEKLREKFSEQRWASFQKDLKFIQKLRSSKKWDGPISDRGFNPSPAWLALHYPLLNMVDITKTNVLKKLATVQVFLYVIAFGFAIWGFGIRTTLVGTTWVALYFGNKSRLLGGYFPYDWFVLIVIAAALYKRRKYFAAAPVLAYSAMMRGFPGLLALHSAFRWVKELVLHRRLHRAHTRFLAALVVSCLALVLLGSITGQGIKAWFEWKEKISIHSAHHGISYNRLGLKYLFAKDYSTNKWSYSLKKRAKAIEQNATAYKVVQSFMFLILFAALYKRERYDGFVMGFICVYLGMLLSRYYFSTAVLLFTLGATDKWRLGNLITSIYMFAMVAFFYWHDHIKGISPYKTWYFINLSFSIYCLILLVYYIGKDIAQWRAEKAQATS